MVSADAAHEAARTWPWITITLPDMYEGYFASTVTNASLERVPLKSLSKQQLMLLSLQLRVLLEDVWWHLEDQGVERNGEW